jgi:hypothetical protein
VISLTSVVCTLPLFLCNTGGSTVDTETHATVALEAAKAVHAAAALSPNANAPSGAALDVASPTSVAVTVNESNTMTMGQQAHVRKLWGDHEPRMQAAKQLFDPHNVFGGNIPGFAAPHV